MLATAAIIVFAPDDQQTYDNFAAAVGIPMTVILPIIGILAVTSEWSQRSGLTTFTLVPHRGRVLWAKFIAAVGVGVAAMFVALVVGALGTLVGSLVTGLDPVWNFTAAEFGLVVLGSVLGMLFGFMLGVLIRNSAGAIVAYFVYSLVLPPLRRAARGERLVVRRRAALDRLRQRPQRAVQRQRHHRAVAAAGGVGNPVVPPSAGRRPVHRAPGRGEVTR